MSEFRFEGKVTNKNKGGVHYSPTDNKIGCALFPAQPISISEQGQDTNSAISPPRTAAPLPSSATSSPLTPHRTAVAWKTPPLLRWEPLHRS